MSYSYSNKVVVGISSRSSQRDLQWLMDFIRRTFPGLVSDVKYLQITNNNAVEWEENVRRCSVGILYHTKHQGRLNIVDVDGALYNGELRSLSDTLGISKVLVVLDDLENCSDSERWRILEAQPSLRRLSSELLLFPEAGKIEEAYKNKEKILRILGTSAFSQAPQAITAKPKGSLYSSYSFLPSIFSRSSTPKSSETSPDSKQNCFPKDSEKCKAPMKLRLNIGIFSRSSQSDYEWLMDHLRTSCRPGDIRPVHITNNSNKFYSELPLCSFAILYHTQKQGRLNITDVTDSLYNDELKELSKRLGKVNVIVVIDDLQNTNSDEKNRILRSQPSIGRLARDLYLFKEREKNSENLERIKEVLKERSLENLHVVDKKSESLRTLKPIDQFPSPGQVQADYLPSSAAICNPSSDFRIQPSASGERGRSRDPCDHSDQSEEPELKRPFLNTNQMELFKSLWVLIEDLCTKGAPFFDIFNKISELRPFLQQGTQELQMQISEMEKQIQANEEIIKQQEHSIITLNNKVESKDQSLRSQESKIQQMESEEEEKALEIRRLWSKVKSYETEGQEKEQRLQNKDLVIRDLQKKVDEMQRNKRGLEEVLQKESQKEMEEKKYRKMNTMSCVAPKDNPTMDEDCLIDLEEHSVDAADTWKNDAEKESMKRRVKELEKRVQELEIQLETVQQNCEEIIADILKTNG